MTVSMDVGAVRLAITRAGALHGMPAQVEPIDWARVALKRLGFVGKSNERDRRPTEEELTTLFATSDDDERLTIPMTRISKFVIATAMRQEKICPIT